MGCGCGGGSNTVHNTATQPTTSSFTLQGSTGECDYTLSQIQEWLAKVNCFKDKGLYATVGIQKRRLNIYIGTLMSAINLSNNICHFKNELKEIETFMVVVNSLGAC